MSGWKDEVDRPMAHELELEIENDGTFYRQRIWPTTQSFQRRRKNGTFDALARKQWRNLVDAYVRTYAPAHGMDSRAINGATRDSVAEVLDAHYAGEYR